MKNTGLRSWRRGVTLVELLVVVALIAIVLGVAVPSFRSMMEMQRLRGVSAQFQTDVQFTRTEAASRQEVTGLSFSDPASTGLSCYVIHTCGTTSPGACWCDCTQAEGSRCAAPQREIRTVLVTPDSGVKLVSVLVGGNTVASRRVRFNPSTGGMTSYGNPGVSLEPAALTTEFWAVASLTTAGSPRSLRTEVSLAGRPKSCVPSGSTVTGGSPCTP